MQYTLRYFNIKNVFLFELTYKKPKITVSLLKSKSLYTETARSQSDYRMIAASQ